MAILEESHYYPFGMKHANYNTQKSRFRKDASGNTYAVLEPVERSNFQYKFNGQEYQDELGLNMTAMDYRQYDNALGRFNSVDALAELMPGMNPYRFGFNNPVSWSDPTGLFETIAQARAHMEGLGYGSDDYYISPDGNGGFTAYYRGMAFTAVMDADNVDGGYLDEVNMAAGGGGGFKVIDILDTATDFVPFSGIKDIYKGARDGNGWVIAAGVGFVVFDVLTMGSGSLIRGTVKTIGKQLLKKSARNAINEVEELVVKEVIEKTVTKKLPIQIHHFATNKSKTFTPQMSQIADEFGLSLNGAWNKQALPHLGRHPNDYHKFVLRGMENARAGGSQAEFLNLFNQYVKQPVIQNPGLLRKSGW